MNLPRAICLTLLTTLTTGEGRLPCGGLCETVFRRGMSVPQYCGVEDRCEPCISACNFPHVPIPCWAFCTGVSQHTEPEPSTKVPDNGQTGNRSVSTQCSAGQHGNIMITILSLLLVSALLNIALVHPVTRTRLSVCCGWNLNAVSGVTHAPGGTGGEATDLKVALMGGEVRGSQSSLATQRSSDESLRHIRTHPEDESNARRELDTRSPII